MKLAQNAPMNSGRGSECVSMWLADDIGGVMSVSSWSPLVLRSCFWLISSVSALSCSTKCAVLISYFVHWMQPLSPISIKTMKMKTFSWGTFVDSVIDALLKVCEDEHGIYSDKNKQKLSICSPLTKLFKISTLCYFLLSNLPFSLFPMFFPWGKLFLLFHAVFSSPHSETPPQTFKVKAVDQLLVVLFPWTSLQGYRSRGSTSRFIFPMIWTIP